MASMTAPTLGQSVAVDSASPDPFEAWRRRRRAAATPVGGRTLLMRRLGDTQQPEGASAESAPEAQALSPVPLAHRAQSLEPLKLPVVHMEMLQRQFQRLGSVLDALTARGRDSASAPTAPLDAAASVGAAASATPVTKPVAQEAGNPGLLQPLKPLIDLGTSLAIVGGAVAGAAGVRQLPTLWHNIKTTVGADATRPGPRRATVIEDYPLGADAMPAPVAGRPASPGTWSTWVDAGKRAAPAARLDAALKTTYTAMTATTPEQRGEGYGGAAGGLLGTLLGAGAGKVFLKRFGGEEAGALVGGFVGDKLSAWAGKSAMTEDPQSPLARVDVQGEPLSQPRQQAGPLASSPDTLSPQPSDAIGAAVQTTLLVGTAAVLTRRRRSPRPHVPDSPEILGADAGPSPSGSPPRTPLRTRLWEGAKKAGKLTVIEAGLKAAHTYTTATTAEEKGAGYGAALGGMVGAAVGTAVGSVVPGIGTLIGGVVGGFIGDKLGAAFGGAIGRYVSTPADTSPSSVPAAQRSVEGKEQGSSKPLGASLTTPLLTPPSVLPVSTPVISRIDAQAGTRIGRQLLGAGNDRPAAPVSIPLRLPTMPESASAPAVAPALPLVTSVPQAPSALPDTLAVTHAVAAPSQASSSAVQHVNLTASIPITVQSAIDAPNQLARDLEAAVKRVMADLQARAGQAQMADAPQPF